MKLFDKYFSIKGLMMAFVLTLVAFPFLAFAQALTDPKTIQDAIALLPLLVTAVKSGAYLLAGAILTLILVLVARLYVLPNYVTKAWYPIVTQAIGLFVGLILAKFGATNQTEAMLSLFSGPTAATFWSTLVKYWFADRLKKVEPKTVT